MRCLVCLLAVALVGVGCSSAELALDPPEVETTTGGPETLVAEGPVMVPASDQEMCDLFDGDDIRRIVGDAYLAEGLEHPVPETLEERVGGNTLAVPAGVGCVWAAPGTELWFSADDFAVSLADISDQSTGYDDDGLPVEETFLDRYHRVGAEGYELFFLGNEEDLGLQELIDEDVVLLSGTSGGSGVFTRRVEVYVEVPDRILSFRHDLSAQVPDRPAEDPEAALFPQAEEIRVDLRIINGMLDHLGWLPVDG